MRNHKIIRGLNKNQNCSKQVSHTRGFPCQKSYWFSKENSAAHPRDICYKREVKCKEKESKVHSGCSVVTPHFTLPSTRKKKRAQGNTATTSDWENQLVSELKRESRKKH